MPSQQAIRSFLERHESATVEVTQTNQPTPSPSTAATRTTDLPHLASANPLHDRHLLEVDEPSSPASNESAGEYSTNGGTDLSPKAKKLQSMSPKGPALRLSPSPASKKITKVACLFCRKRKIACGPPLPGSTNQTCR